MFFHHSLNLTIYCLPHPSQSHSTIDSFLLDKPKTKLKAGNRAQLDAFSRMSGNIQETIDLYAADFRTIIWAFELAQESDDKWRLYQRNLMIH